jgi:hypothetical protein
MMTTILARFDERRRGLLMHKKGITVAVLAAALVGCQASDLNVPSPNSATVSGATSDPTALQLLFTGLFSDIRGQRANMIQESMVFGREGYTLSPQDGRFATVPLIGVVVGGVTKIDPAVGFANNPWAGEYGVLRDLFNFKNAISGAGTLTTAQKAALLGVAQTFDAYMMADLVQAHDSLGAITEIKADASQLAPFVSRDSVYKFIIGSLQQAVTNLNAGGATFAYKLPPGFAGFDTPATFVKFTQALLAKEEAHYATAGGGSSAWAAAVTALNASFLNLNATTRTAFDVGPFNTYGVAPDSPNGLTQATNTNLYAHMSLQRDAQLKANGQPDDRYTAKIRTGLPARSGPVAAGLPTTETTTLGFSIWPAQNSPISILRNEELILLHAEAMLATGNKAAAITDINTVRVNSGGLPPTTLTASSSDDAVLNGILYEKRYSTLMEGNRWIDMRRYNKLDQLPLDVTSGPNKNFVAKVNPIPQAECLVRQGQTGDFLGPNGLNNCAP